MGSNQSEDSIRWKLYREKVSATGCTSLHEPSISAYLTGHLKRYGDYIVDFDNLPQPLETAMVIPIEPETQ